MTERMRPASETAGGRPELVIFDCDGVLVDSEPLSLGTLTAALNRIGVAIDGETVRRRFAGTSMTSIMGHIAQDYPDVAVPDEFVDAVRIETLEVFDRKLRAVAGAAEAIQALDVPTCVASSSDPVRLRHSLTLTGLLPLFEGRLFSSAMVERGKPFPDLFLHAAATMSTLPAKCLVIEDSVPGVTAARAAGMRVLGFTGAGHWAHDRDGKDLAEAGVGRIFRDYRDLEMLLGQSA